MRKAFEALKDAIAHAPMLKYTDFNRKFYLATDASDVGIGAVLYQPTDEQLKNNDTRVHEDNIIAVFSRSLRSYEKNYIVYHKECLAIVEALEYFSDFLYGRHFFLYTDHYALLNVIKHAPKQRTLRGWLQSMWHYDFTIKHIAGEDNILADALSRLYPNSPNIWNLSHKTRTDLLYNPHDEDTEAQIAALLASPDAEEKVAEIDSTNSSTSSESKEPHTIASHTSPLDIPLRDEDDYISLAATRDALPDKMPHETFMRTLGLEIPAEEKRSELLQKVHELGHFSVNKMVTTLMSQLKVYWPNMARDVAKFVNSCDICQRVNIVREGFHPPRSPTTASPGILWEIDIMHCIESTDGNKYALIVLDNFSRYCLARPLKDLKAATIAKELYTLMCEWGTPQFIHSDEGTEFTNTIIKELLKLFQVKISFATVDYHRSMGAVERTIRTVRALLRKMLRGSSTLWDYMLPWVLYLYNTSIRQGLKSTPYAIHFGRAQYPLNLPDDKAPSQSMAESLLQEIKLPSPDEDKQHTSHVEAFNMQDWLRHQGVILQKVYPAIKQLMQATKTKTAEQFQKRKRIVKPLQVGDRVMAKDPNTLHKLQDPYIGPFTVQEILPQGTYKIGNARGDFHIKARSQLKLIPALGADEDEEDLWTVDKIIDHKKDDAGRHLYRVRWKGFTAADDTWEPAASFDDFKTVDLYWRSVGRSRSRSILVAEEHVRSQSLPRSVRRKRKAKAPAIRATKRRKAQGSHEPIVADVEMKDVTLPAAKSRARRAAGKREIRKPKKMRSSS